MNDRTANEIAAEPAVADSTCVKKTWTVGTLTYTAGSLAALFGWLLWGDFAWSMRDRAIPPIMQMLFKRYDVSDATAGVLFHSLPLAFGLVIGPFISYLSDHHRGRRGRRIPYLLFTIPFIVVGIVGMAFSPPLGVALHNLLGVHSPGLNTSTLIVMGSFLILFELACGIAYGVFFGLVNDVVPQSLVGRFFGWFRIVGLVAGIVLGYWLLGMAETLYVWILLGVGVLYGGGFSLMCWKVKEGEYPPPPPRASGNLRVRFLTAARSYLKIGYGHSYYLWYFASYYLTLLTLIPFNLYSVFYAKAVGMDMGTYGKCQAITFVISICLAYPLGALSDRFHPLRTTFAVLILNAITMLWCGLGVSDAKTYAVAVVATTLMAGCTYTVSLSLPQRLLAREHFAQISSAGGTINSLVGIVFAPALGALLDYKDHDYRYIFFVAFAITVAALVATAVLHRKFMAIGGPKHYVAPE